MKKLCFLFLLCSSVAMFTACEDGEDDSVNNGNTNQHQPICLLTLEGHTDRVNSAFYSPDGSRIVSASNDKSIRIWDANSGQCWNVLTAHDSYVKSANYNFNGTRIVSASWDETIKIWDANTGECL
jgi:WD40 repeat protein